MLAKHSKNKFLLAGTTSSAPHLVQHLWCRIQVPWNIIQSLVEAS